MHAIHKKSSVRHFHPREAEYRVGRTFGNRIFVNHGLYINEALQEIGYANDKNYSFYHADGDLCLRLWENGYTCISSPDSYIEHFYQAGRRIKAGNKAFQKEDWEQYLKTWGHLGHPTEPWETLKHIDVYKTAEKNWLHKDNQSLSSITQHRISRLFRRKLPGQLIRLIKSVRKFLYQLISRDSANIKVHKATLSVPRDMIWAYRGGEYYERNVSHWLDRIVKCLSSPTFYDVGANIGYFTIKMADSCQHVVAFEPSSKTFDTLTTNIASNNINNVHCYRLGILDRDGEVELFLYSSCGNDSFYERDLPAGHDLALMNKELVPVRTLDSFQSETDIPPPDVVKIDVEGAELFVLQGAMDVLGSYRPVLMIEFGISTSLDAGYQRNDILAFLNGFNYTTFGLSEDVDNNDLYNLDDGDEQISNLISFPSEKIEIFQSILN